MIPSVAPLIIRSARIADWPRLRRTVQSIFPHLSEAEVSYQLRQHHAATVVACRGADICGYYQFYAHADAGVAWLNFIGVVPRARGQGDAEILLTFFTRHAKTCGFESVALDVFEDKQRAQRFYERRGFTRHTKQAHADGVKWRFLLSLTDVAPFERPMPSIRPAGPLVRAWRKLAYVALSAVPPA